MHHASMRKLMGLLSASALVGALFLATLPGVVSAATCSATGYTEDGINLTAAIVNPTAAVTGTVDATGCNIGVYYGPGTTGTVTGADISHANYYGVLVDGATVDVTDSTIHDIGESPLNGAQHGDAIAYRNGATGTISDNTVYHYQKTGILVTTGSNAQVLNNTVTGEGPISYIAQNGIQASYGASAEIIGNAVTGNWYLPKSYVSCGLLIYKADGVSASKGGLGSVKAENNFHGNEVDICNFGKGGGFSAS